MFIGIHIGSKLLIGDLFENTVPIRNNTIVFYRVQARMAMKTMRSTIPLNSKVVGSLVKGFVVTLTWSSSLKTRLLSAVSPDTHNAHGKRNTRDGSPHSLSKLHSLNSLSNLLAIDIVALCL